MRLYILSIIVLINLTTQAREGMWMPQLLKELNESDMKSMGMEITADDIYSINHSSLKDAVLQFGGGCTGELISEKGLLITNHHCGFYQIQSLSTIEKNYLQDGFWANSFEEEKPCPGLTVTFIREITDVTTSVLSGVDDTLNEDARAAVVKIRSDSIEKSVSGKLKGIVRAFYQGNKYYLFVTEVYSDIRFVGAPPQTIGKFGGETDNWMWPRHTGDFSLFRIYADKDNNPAAYSKDNIPYTPKQFLTINIGGVKENDFVFVFGFPGRTYEYIFSSSLELIANQTNPNRIAIRDVRLDIWRKAMNKNDTVRLQYASKFSSLENTYKKWQGEVSGFKRFNAIDEKKIKEDKFISEIKGNPALAGDTILFTTYNRLNDEAKPLNYANDYYAEAFTGVELLNASARFKPLVTICIDKNQKDSVIQGEVKKIINDIRIFYKNYNSTLDRKICSSLLKLSYSKLEKQYLPKQISDAGLASDDFKKYTDELFDNSILADSSRAIKFFSSFRRKDSKKIINDPAYSLLLSIIEIQLKLQTNLGKLNKEMMGLQRKYMNDLLLADKTKKLFPDANSTLRVSYGRVEGTNPADGMHYDFFTTADGVLAKSETENDEYKIPPRLAALIKNKDYGQFGSLGVMPVAFMMSSHTTGGNSGSPVLNSKGELVGINYDRMWEGVLSDYYYDERYCRNICLDIRYALFIIEKYGKAERIINEMRILK